MFIERDQKIAKMQLDLDQKLTEIYDQIDPRPIKPSTISSGGLPMFSVEDAMKELLAMGIKE